MNTTGNKSLFRVFCWGMMISFLGTLPPGALNLVATYVSASNGIPAAFAFVLGCIIAEMLFVRAALISLNWISRRQQLFRKLEWITIMIIVALAILSFRAAIYHRAFSSALPGNFTHPFWSGILISSLDPMKIPFWFLWSTFLMSNTILIPEKIYYNFYVPGIGLGSLFGFMVFIYGGDYLISAFKEKQNIINWIIGSILLVTAIIQIYRTLQRRQTQTSLLHLKNMAE